MKKHIMLVDEGKEQLNFFVEAMDKTGITYKCTWATSGAQAFSQLQYLTPDIIFLNLDLPGMEGLTILPEIRNIPRLADAAIVVYSAGMDGDACKNALALGATACLKMPGSTFELAEELKAVLQEEYSTL